MPDCTASEVSGVRSALQREALPTMLASTSFARGTAQVRICLGGACLDVWAAVRGNLGHLVLAGYPSCSLSAHLAVLS